MFTQILPEQHGEGQALALRGRRAVFRLRNPLGTIARGPVPRERPVDRSMARDRPSPYAEGAVFRLRNPHGTGARGPVPRERMENSLPVMNLSRTTLSKRS